MSAYSVKRSADYIRTYRTLLYDSTRSKPVSKTSSNIKIYKPRSTVSTTDATSIFIPLFYAGEKGALGIWDKRTGMGTVKRRLDDDHMYHVLEISNPRTNLGTSISSPKSPMNALHITLPHLLLVMKNFRRNFAFDVLVMDNMAYRRRFCFATWYNPSALKKFAFMCQVPLRLEIGWNEIHVDFRELVRNTYKTEYVETIRIQIYANCKLRQIFFCDDRIMGGQVPIPSIRDFGNIKILPLDYGPRTHPDGIEPGPDRKRSMPYIDPPHQIPASRLELDLRVLQRRRFAQITDQKLYIQPYKTYFRELLREERQRKKIQAALKAQLDSKSIGPHLEAEGPSNKSAGEISGKQPTFADIRDLLSNNHPNKHITRSTAEAEFVGTARSKSPGGLENKARTGLATETRTVVGNISENKSDK